MTSRTVSIVTPTYNCAPLLRRAIESVRRQTWLDWEMLVVDNFSQDDTAAVVSEFNDPRIRYFRIHNNGIIAKSRNLALSNARGQWIAFLDADDWWSPTKLACSVQALEQGSDIVYHDLKARGPGARLRRRIQSRSLRSPVFDDLILNGNAILNSSVVVSRPLMDRIGGLSEDPALVAAEDLECWLRLARLTERFRRLHGAYGYYWIGSANTTNPQRTLTTLTELRRRMLDHGHIAKSPHWIAFAIAKAHMHMGDRAAALTELDNIDGTEATVIMRLKKLTLKWMLSRRPR